MRWPKVDPIAFDFLGIDIMWYGVLVATAVVSAGTVIYIRAPKYAILRDNILDVFLVCIPLGVIGARMYYVIFHWDYYGFNFSRIIDFREGGGAIHGGLFLGALGVLLICRLKKIQFLNCLDLMMPGIALGQAIGRWGNYFNMEAHGGLTDLPWGILVDGEFVHPAFLYESLWCLILFVFLLGYENKRRFTGQIFCLYGILYSVERFLVEGLRTDSLMLGPLRQAQLVSLLVIVSCIILYMYLYRRERYTRKN